MKLFAFVLIATLALVNASSRPIDKIKHIVIFMQENRAFDHYYGTLQGVRGFNDRAATPVQNGFNTFYQLTDVNDMSKYMLPFHVNSLTTSAICMDAPDMSFPTDIGMMHGGRYDYWNLARNPGMGMSFFNRTDLPYYFTLYDNFAVGDQYYMSSFTATNPNRMHLFTGSNGLSAKSNMTTSPCVDDTEPVPGWDWITMGEILEAANVSWKVYQQADNFDDNAFAWFRNYQNATPGNPLYDKGMARSVDMIADLENDIKNGKLPQVSWLVGPANVSEHATYHPSAGEDFSARILQVIQRYPETYANMAFILNYDEGGQFYDHHWTPNPPMDQPNDGISTVDTSGDVWRNSIFGAAQPIGPGYRVPLLVISPWTRGNIVVSEAFDHTSVIRFIEQRFNVTCPVISEWRRAVTGDLLSAFNFSHADYTWPVLPNTSAYPGQSNKECANLPPPEIPATQSFPQQEKGVRISRALPYEFTITDEVVSPTVMSLGIQVTGTAGAAFILYDATDLANINPRKYGVEGGKAITDKVPIVNTDYSFALHGPNGFVRQFAGNAQESMGLKVEVLFDKKSSSLGLRFHNKRDNADALTFKVHDNAYGGLVSGTYTVSHTTTDADVQTYWYDISRSGRWYDFTVRAGMSFQRRYMGHMEDGTDSISDPAMAAGVPATGPGIAALPKLDRVMSKSVDAKDHPLIPEKYRKFTRKEGVSKDHKYYHAKEEL